MRSNIMTQSKTYGCAQNEANVQNSSQTTLVMARDFYAVKYVITRMCMVEVSIPKV